MAECGHGLVYLKNEKIERVSADDRRKVSIFAFEMKILKWKI